MNMENTLVEKINTVLQGGKVRAFTESFDLNLFLIPKSKKVLKLTKLDLTLDQKINVVYYVTNSTTTPLEGAILVSPKE